MENLSQQLDRTKIRVSMNEGFLGCSGSGAPIPLTDLDSEAHRWNPTIAVEKTLQFNKCCAFYF